MFFYTEFHSVADCH